MIWLYEFGALAILGGVVWILFRAARERSDQRDLGWVAWIGLAVWLVFVAGAVLRSGLLDDMGALLRGLAILAVIVGAVLGYRHLLGLIRARHGDR